MAEGRFVAYYRVSTQAQGRSGLGLAAQQSAVRNYLDGGRWSLIAEYTEVESGKKNDRPKLAEAMRTAKRQKATLVIAKLDRLARSVAEQLAAIAPQMSRLARDAKRAAARPDR